MVNIAFFDATPKWSGGANRILFLAKELTKAGNNVLIICLPKSNLSEEAKKVALEVVNIKPVVDLGLISFFKILNLLKKYKIEVVDINSPKFYWIGLYAAKTLGIKVILTRNVPYRKKGIKKFFNRLFLYNQCDLVITLCEYVKKLLERDFRLRNVKVNYDGFWNELKKLSLEEILQIKKKYNINQDEFVLATIGRVEESKGVSIAIDAVSQVKTEMPNIKLLVVGTGNVQYIQKLKEIVRRKNIEDSITFTGFVENTYEIYNIIDVLLHPSYFDSVPICILEAFGYSKPVIASNTGGIPEIVEDGKNGYLFSTGNAKSLAERIGQLLISDYMSLGLKGKETINRKFSKENMVRNYTKLLKELLGK